MIKKVILIVIVLLVTLAVVFPAILRFTGYNSYQLTSLGRGGSTGQGIIRSENSGLDWAEAAVSENKKNRFPANIFSLTFHPKEAEIIFLATKGSGLWKSANAGRSWNKITDSAKVLKSTADVYKVAVSRQDPKKIYLAVYQDGRGRVLKSADEGRTFQEIYAVNSNRFGVFDIFLNPANSEGATIITGEGGFLETQDGGKTWKVKKWFGQSLSQLLVNPDNPAEMYLITSNDDLYKTVDKGENWINLNENIRTGWNLIYQPDIPAEGDTLVTGSAVSGGDFNISNSLETMTIDPNVTSTLYMGLPNALIRSRNGAYSWSKVDTPVPPNSLPISAVAVTPGNSNLIFAGAGSQLYKSSDAGQSWKIINLPVSKKIKDIYISPLRRDLLFILMN